MKKVLVLTVTAGNGHNSCAKGIKEKLESYAKEIGQDVEVKVVNMLEEYSDKFNVWISDSGYDLAIGKLPHIYEQFYFHYKKKSPQKRYVGGPQPVCTNMCDGLLREIYTYKPDVIFCTHYNGATCITDLKLVAKLPCTTIGVVLDYCLSPFWEMGIGVDYMVCPNEDFVLECIEKGYKKDQLKPFGIPVKDEFSKHIDKQIAREQLGLAKDIFTVMIIFGGGHWKGGMQIFKDVVACVRPDEKMQIIMINGRNKKDFDKIEKMHFPDNIVVKNVGFTDKVALFLSASDLAISKNGGTGATEFLNKKIPSLITSKVYAQERLNLEYLKKRGVTKEFSSRKQLDKILHDLKNNPEKIEQMSKNAEKLSTNAMEDIAKFIMQLPNATYNEEEIANTDYSTINKRVKKALKLANKNAKNSFMT